MSRNRLQAAGAFSLSYAQWLMMGKPLRSPERITELFAICEPCNEYNPKLWTPYGRGGCHQCKCHISGDTEKDINKLAWPHESCPLKKWLAEVREVKDG